VAIPAAVVARAVLDNVGWVDMIGVPIVGEPETVDTVDGPAIAGALTAVRVWKLATVESSGRLAMT